MTATLDQKAQRLHRDGRAVEIEARSFLVRGDHGVYLVTVPKNHPALTYCTCPARNDCSHRGVVNRVLLAEENEPRSVGAPAAHDHPEEIPSGRNRKS